MSNARRTGRAAEHRDARTCRRVAGRRHREAAGPAASCRSGMNTSSFATGSRVAADDSSTNARPRCGRHTSCSTRTSASRRGTRPPTSYGRPRAVDPPVGVEAGDGELDGRWHGDRQATGRHRLRADSVVSAGRQIGGPKGSEDDDRTVAGLRPRRAGRRAHRCRQRHRQGHRAHARPRRGATSSAATSTRPPCAATADEIAAARRHGRARAHRRHAARRRRRARRRRAVRVRPGRHHGQHRRASRTTRWSPTCTDDEFERILAINLKSVLLRLPGRDAGHGRRSGRATSSTSPRARSTRRRRRSPATA